MKSWWHGTRVVVYNSRIETSGFAHFRSQNYQIFPTFWVYGPLKELFIIYIWPARNDTWRSKNEFGRSSWPETIRKLFRALNYDNADVHFCLVQASNLDQGLNCLPDLFLFLPKTGNREQHRTKTEAKTEPKPKKVFRDKNRTKKWPKPQKQKYHTPLPQKGNFNGVECSEVPKYFEILSVLLSWSKVHAECFSIFLFSRLAVILLNLLLLPFSRRTVNFIWSFTANITGNPRPVRPSIRSSNRAHCQITLSVRSAPPGWCNWSARRLITFQTLYCHRFLNCK